MKNMRPFSQPVLWDALSALVPLLLNMISPPSPEQCDWKLYCDPVGGGHPPLLNHTTWHSSSKHL